MAIRLTRGKLTRAALSSTAALFMLLAASDGYAGPRGGDSGMLFTSPHTIKPPPSPPKVRDHREHRYWHPPKTLQNAQGGVRVTTKKGGSKRSNVRDHRSQ
jgi:hypothetical protein